MKEIKIRQIFYYNTITMVFSYSRAKKKLKPKKERKIPNNQREHDS